MGEVKSAEVYFEKRLKNRRPGTQKIYRTYLGEFLVFAGLSIEGLYDTHWRGLSSGDPREGSEVTQLVADWLHYLEEEKGFADGTIWNYLKAIRFFFKANKLPFELDLEDLPSKTYSGQRAISKEQVRLLHDYVGEEFRERNRAMIMMGKDLGFRISDICKLQHSHCETATRILDDEGMTFLRMVPIKTIKKGYFADPHIGPEAVKAMDAFIEVRGTHAGPLFEKRGGGELGRKGGSAIFLRLASKLPGGGFGVSAHSFRKYHNTQLEGAGMNTNWIKSLQGKSHYEYSDPQGLTITEKYIECYPHLRVFDDVYRIDKLEYKYEGVLKTLQTLQREIIAANRLR